MNAQTTAVWVVLWLGSSLLFDRYVLHDGGTDLSWSATFVGTAAVTLVITLAGKRFLQARAKHHDGAR